MRRTEIPRAAIRAAALLCALWLGGALADRVAAQSNGSSFTDRDRLIEVLGEARRGPTAPCAGLRAQSDLETTIVAAQPLTGPGTGASLCQVHGVIVPEVQFLLELPSQWNGRLYVLGNFGYGGESLTGDYGRAERERAHALGFATVFTNLGHDQNVMPGATWARQNLARRIDFGLRGLHVTTEAAKRFAKLYYGEPPRRSYFDGCSTGGGQGLKAAQRFPADYDGIVAGAPVYDFVRLQLYGWNNQMAIARAPLSQDKVALLAKVILEKFDNVDGVRDGVIGDPAAIDFIPTRDLPHASGGRAGFTDLELEALTRIYRGTVLDGKELAPGLPVGAEPAGQTYLGYGTEPGPLSSGWTDRLIANSAGYVPQRDLIETWLKYLAFDNDDPQMTLEQFDPRRDLPRLSTTTTQILDATDADLSAFRAGGGKLLVYHGWADTGVNPRLTTDYFNRVNQGMGTSKDFFRLFMVPGMFHCRGGVNVDRFDALTSVVRWVEKGEAPEQLTAARVENGKSVRTRPLCSYPSVARYVGRGSTDDITAFRCTDPPGRAHP